MRRYGNSNRGLAFALSARIEQRYKGFDEHYRLGTSNALAFEPIDCRDWHSKMWERIFKAVGSGQHFPVFRMSHGEFTMAVGYRVPCLDGRTRWFSRLATQYLNVRKAVGLAPAFLSGSSSNSWETFTKAELRRAYNRYVHCLRAIAQEGLLAAAFYDNAGFSEYFPDYLHWLDRNGIDVTPNNYMSFYSVYAGMAGEESQLLVRERRVLVVTCLPNDKAPRLRNALADLGAKHVQFIEVSASKAMFDRLNLEKVELPVDVILIGAGVGSASILREVAPLKAVALDVGFCLDCLAYPEKRWERPFCVPDDVFDLQRVRFLAGGRESQGSRISRGWLKPNSFPQDEDVSEADAPTDREGGGGGRAL
jgi:hypothetical protein